MSPQDFAMKALFGILLPALVAGITWGAIWKIWNRSAAPISGGTWSGSLAVGLAFIAGYIGTEGWPGFPPHTAIGWLLFIAIAAMLAGLVEIARFQFPGARATSAPPKLQPICVITWLPVAIFALVVLTETPRKNWIGGMLYIWCGALTLALWLIPQAIDLLARRWPGASIPLSLWVWTAGIAASLAVTGSIQYGHLAGILAAVMGAGLVAAWIKPTIIFAGGAVAALITLGLGFLLCGYFYSDLPANSALILAASPLILWLGSASFVSNRKPWLAVVMRATFIALPVALALVFAAWPMLFPKPSTGANGSSSEADFYK